MAACVSLYATAVGQDKSETRPGAAAAGRLAPSGDSIKAIEDEYNEQRLRLERQRLERLAQLAERQGPAAAEATYEQLFRLAIAGNLFVEAGPAAETVVKKGNPSPVVRLLANLVKIIAEADRGAYEQSLESLRRVVVEGSKAAVSDAAVTGILTHEKVGLLDAYYQRLVHADQLDVARQAFRLLGSQVRNPAVADFVASRLRRLELVGKPAPGIRGTDIEGKPFNLSDARGKVVLVNFWATWCLPNALEVDEFLRVAEAYRGKGFEVVGINLDAQQDGGPNRESVLANVRTFLLDHNVRWPTLVNGPGEQDFAAAYGVTEIPTNVLVDRDGKIVQIDLVNKNLESVVARVVAQ